MTWMTLMTNWLKMYRVTFLERRYYGVQKRDFEVF